MCLKLTNHSTPITGRASPAPGCHVRLSPAPLHSPGKGLGPPSQRESQGLERSRQCPKAPQLARARASEPFRAGDLQKPSRCRRTMGSGWQGNSRGKQLRLLGRKGGGGA